MAKRRTRRRSYTPVPSGPLGQQAQLQAELRFSPEASALGHLLSQTRRDFRQQVRQEKSIAKAVDKSAKKAIPGVKSDYKATQRTHRVAQERLDRQLADLSPVADDIVAASAREAAGQRTRIAEAKASAVGELRNRRSQARASAQFNIQAARGQFRENRGDIASRILDLAKERGTFTAATLMQLQAAKKQAQLAKRGQNLTFKAAKARVKQTRRSAEETARHNRAQERLSAKQEARIRAQGGKEGKGKDWLSPGQRNSELDKIQSALSYIKKLEANPRLSSSKIRELVEQGYSVSSSAGKPGVKIPPHPHDYVNAAYDLYVRGHLSRPNRRALRGRGVRIPNRWKPKGPSTARKAGRAAGRAAKNLL